MLDTQVVILVRIVCGLHLAHQLHEDDAVEARLPNVSVAEAVDSLPDALF